MLYAVAYYQLSLSSESGQKRFILLASSESQVGETKNTGDCSLQQYLK